MFKASIHVTLKKSVLDPQGQTVLHALESLGFREAKGLRVGKFFEMHVDAADQAAAEKSVRAMCDRVLTNPVIEEYNFRLERQ
jgi:phosphoribosylformylglycinamidine synthase